MSIAAFSGWFVQPFVWLGLIPAIAAYYWLHAPRQGLAWHLGFFGVLLVGLGPNLWWLADWIRFWWLRQSGTDDSIILPNLAESLGSFRFYKSLIGKDAINWLGFFLSVGGLVLFLIRKNGSSVLLLALPGLAAVVVSKLDISASPCAETGTGFALLLIPALAVIPTAYLISSLARIVAWTQLLILPVAFWPLLGAWVPQKHAKVPASLRMNVRPFHLGIPAELDPLITKIYERTSNSARILIEEQGIDNPGWNWTALFPVLTQRVVIGGLDPEAKLEHLSITMKNGRLSGRRFEEWSDKDRSDWCDRYNVGWVLCHSPEAIRWWSNNPAAMVIGRFANGLTLFEIDRKHSYIRSGSATVSKADHDRIVLTDVMPDDHGYVRLSFHFLRELKAMPLHVSIEPDPDPTDPVPFMKLKVPGPVSRITLVWDHP